MRPLLMALFFISLTPLVQAQNGSADAVAEDIYPLATPELEARFDRLVNELRCPKCQNQNIADSDAPIAGDMRSEVYRMVQDGASEQAVVDAMVQRFGEFVHYKPAFDHRTALLWLLPVIVVVAGLLAIVVIVRRSGRGGESSGSGLTDEQRRRADELLR